MNYSKFKKGQVWRFNDKVQSVGSEQSKSHRPWVIISCDKCNAHSPVVTCAPLTSREFDHKSYHVPFTDSNKTRCILIEQMTCCSILRFESANYMYTVDDSVLDLIDKAIKVHLGLKLDIENYLSTLNNYLEEIIQDKINQLKQLQLPLTTAESISDKLTQVTQELHNISVVKPISSEDKDSVNYIENIVDSSEATSVINTESITFSDGVILQKQLPTRSYEKVGRTKWTPEYIAKFLEDCNKYAYSDLARMYNLKSAKVVSQYRSKFRNYEK